MGAGGPLVEWAAAQGVTNLPAAGGELSKVARGAVRLAASRLAGALVEFLRRAGARRDRFGRVGRQGEEELHAADDERRGPDDVDLDEQRRQVSEVLHVADAGLGHEHRHEQPPRPPDPLGHVEHVERHGERQHDADQQQGEARVELGHGPQRDGDPARLELVLGGPRVGARAGDGGTGQDHHAEQGDGAPGDQEHRPHDEEASGAGRVVARAAVEQDRRGRHHGHRQGEVRHDEVRVELRVDHDPAEDGLAQHPGDKPGGQPGEIAPVRAPPQGAEQRGDQDDGQRHGHETVPELDQRVVGELGGEPVLVARGPVGAAEARSAQAHGGARRDDEHDGRQGGDGQAPEGLLADGGQLQGASTGSAAAARGGSDHFSLSYPARGKSQPGVEGPAPPGPAPAVRRRLPPMALEAPALPASRILASRVAAYVALTKPRIIELLLVTTLPTMVLARQGLPTWRLVLATLAGGALSAGGANALNMVADRDIDRVMRRTRNRPLVTGAVTPRAALVFALGLEAVAFAELWGLVNPLSAVLALSAAAFYAIVYTLWLKRRSAQ